jgi:hypothetical protein
VEGGLLEEAIPGKIPGPKRRGIPTPIFMALQMLTIVHMTISLLAIGSGLVVMAATVRGGARHPWSSFFLTTTGATSATGHPGDEVVTTGRDERLGKAGWIC